MLPQHCLAVGIVYRRASLVRRSSARTQTLESCPVKVNHALGVSSTNYAMVTRHSVFTVGAAALLLASLLTLTHGLFCESENCYTLLGVDRSASKSDIRRAYRRLSVEMHPDRNPGDKEIAAKYKLIGDAYGALKVCGPVFFFPACL